MARKRSQKDMQAAPAEAKTKPIRVDLMPPIHKALRVRAANLDMSMAALARKMIAEGLGFKDEEGNR